MRYQKKTSGKSCNEICASRLFAKNFSPYREVKKRDFVTLKSSLSTRKQLIEVKQQESEITFLSALLSECKKADFDKKKKSKVAASVERLLKAMIFCPSIKAIIPTLSYRLRVIQAAEIHTKTRGGLYMISVRNEKLRTA